MMRCVNIDWLEVHCFEPSFEKRDAHYYRDIGWSVRERDYGTRVYREMFTLLDNHGEPFIEVRRCPASAGLNGIHKENECHLRLHNRTCYQDGCARVLASFLESYGYYNIRISRLDICLDFIRFDSGDYPQKFVSRYMSGKYAKINQSELRAYGTDRWDSRLWSSLSWGSPRSMISTKLYNKSKELAESHDKPYIRHAWYLSGLVSDPINQTIEVDGERVKPEIWRLEFSIRSARLRWFEINPGGNDNKRLSLHHTLDCYYSREQLWKCFVTLQQHYFHFRYYEADRRKYDCKRKELFSVSGEPCFYSCGVPVSAGVSSERSLLRLKAKLQKYIAETINDKKRAAVEEVIRFIDSDCVSSFAGIYFSQEELLSLRLAVQGKQKLADVAQRVHNIIQEAEIW